MSFGLSLLLIAGLVAAFMLSGGANPARAEVVTNDCQPGTYHDGTACQPAPAGTYVDTPNALAATPCSAGFYQNLEGQTSCLVAPAGSFVATIGATEATQCSPGTYQPDAGQEACLRAPAGTYVDSIGAIVATPCPAGKTSQAGATECTPIDPGYTFSGFSDPVDADAMNVAKAGQAIPLKFHVSDSSGAPVTDLTDVTVTVASLSCSATTTVDLLEEYATGGSGLQNLGDGYYQYNWKTPKSYASSCKTMSLGLGDGAQHTAQFEFRK